MHKQPLALDGLERLLASLARLSAKHQLGPELPRGRDLPLGLHLGVDNGIVVLEVGAEAFGLEGHPERELVHRRGVLGPGGEVVCVDGELLLEGVDGLGVLEEEDLGGVSAGVYWRVEVWRRVVAEASGGASGGAGQQSCNYVALARNCQRLRLRASSGPHATKEGDESIEGGTHRSVCRLESTDPACGASELVLGHNSLQDIERQVPEFVMLGVEQHDEARGLGVERRRDVEHGLLDESCDLLVGDGGLLVELVDGAAVLDGLEEGLGGSHCCG